MKAKVSYPEVPFIQIDDSISALGHSKGKWDIAEKVDLVPKVKMFDTIKLKLNFS